MTATIRTSAYSVILGILFTPIIYLLANRSLTLCIHIAVLIIVSSQLANRDALWRLSRVRRHLSEYDNIGRFWIESRGRLLEPRTYWRFLQFSFKAFFILGDWWSFFFFTLIYLVLVTTPLFFGFVTLKPRYEIVFVILMLYEVGSLHCLFLFWHWKHKIAKKIKGEYGFDYDSLVASD